MDEVKLKIEQWPIGRLIPYARNPRKNDEVVEKMVSAIREFGFRIPVVAKSDGTVVDGHLRLKAAQKLGLKEVPVALADELTDAQVKAFRLLANKSANWAEWDVPDLALELGDLKEAAFDLELTGFNPIEIEDVLNLADINFSGEKKAALKSEELRSNQASVKVCLAPELVSVLEEAIQQTGEVNRAKAVRKICEAYLEKR